MLGAISNVLSVASSLIDVAKSIKPEQTGPKPPASRDLVTISQEGKEALQKCIEGKELSARGKKLLRSRGLDDGEIQDVLVLLEQARGASDKRGFINSLSDDDKELLRRATSYGSSFTSSAVAEFSDEGVENLLRGPDAKNFVDLNNDGLVDMGAGKTFVFPPPNAPQYVKDAWEKATVGVSDSDRLMLDAPFLTMHLCANIEVDQNGSVKRTEPGEEGYVNPLDLTDVDDWQAMLKEMLSSIAFNRDLDPNPRSRQIHDQQEEVLKRFSSNMMSA